MRSKHTLNEKLRTEICEQYPQLESDLTEIERGEGFFGLLGASFKGRQAWMTYYLYALGLAVFFFAIYSLLGYLDATSIEERLDWGMALMACLFFFVVIKVIGFEQIVKLELQRELRRIEMRLMLLSKNKNEH